MADPTISEVFAKIERIEKASERQEHREQERMAREAARAQAEGERWGSMTTRMQSMQTDIQGVRGDVQAVTARVSKIEADMPAVEEKAVRRAMQSSDALERSSAEKFNLLFARLDKQDDDRDRIEAEKQEKREAEKAALEQARAAEQAASSKLAARRDLWVRIVGLVLAALTLLSGAYQFKVHEDNQRALEEMRHSVDASRTK